jgi:hypothetical protein
MNRRQMCTLVVGILVFILTALFPPVNRVQTMTVVNESSGTAETQEVRSEFHGYAFYSYSKQTPDGKEYRVAKTMLAAEWLLLLILVGNFMKAFRDKPSLPQAPIFHRP